MPEETPIKWEQLQSAFQPPDSHALVMFCISLVLGGILAIYVRFLYRRTSSHVGANSIAKVFPLLTLVTIAVISVVKSSLALSLGLVGALSIVRFRAAIKDPEELVYLFLCIGIGLALGAEQIWLALSLVVGATLFVLIFDRVRKPAPRSEAYLTIVGDASQSFATGDPALEAVRALGLRFTVQRCEVEGGEGQLRVLLHEHDATTATRIVSDLRTKLPDCQVSYVSSAPLMVG